MRTDRAVQVEDDRAIAGAGGTDLQGTSRKNVCASGGSGNQKLLWLPAAAGPGAQPCHYTSEDDTPVVACVTGWTVILSLLSQKEGSREGVFG